jgi:Domain of unknown function (DUF1844)
MSDQSENEQKPRFTVIDRRKLRDDEQDSATPTPPAAEEPQPKSPPRLTLVEPVQKSAPAEESPAASTPEARGPVPVESLPGDDELDDSAHLPPVPSDQEALAQKQAYLSAADRINDLVRAQNPAMPAPEKIGFEHLVQQLYLSAMMQMGAGTPEGQRPRIDILGARQTIDLLDVVADRTAGNLSDEESRTLATVLYELRATFLELTRMISAQPMPPMPPGGPRR